MFFYAAFGQLLRESGQLADMMEKLETGVVCVCV